MSHIFRIPEDILWDTSNGITYCITCHKNKHKMLKDIEK